MSEAFIRAVNKAIAPVVQRVKNMMARGVVTGVSDSGGIQLLQGSILADEVQDGMERFQQYGITSNPPLGSEFIVLFLAGRSHPVVIAVDNPSGRLKDLEPGDSALYSSAGNYVRMQAEDGKIYIDAPHNVIIRSAETIRLEGKRIEFHADEVLKLDVNGRGYDYLPDRTDSFTEGSEEGATNAIAPPEHGDEPAS
jgi:phage baseplate assembly protein V